MSKFAPGTAIVSTSIKLDTTPTIFLGTLMATPHVTGVAALYLQANPMWSPAQVWTAMQNDATPGLVCCCPTWSKTPNLLSNTINII